MFYVSIIFVAKFVFYSNNQMIKNNNLNKFEQSLISCCKDVCHSVLTKREKENTGAVHNTARQRLN